MDGASLPDSNPPFSAHDRAAELKEFLEAHRALAAGLVKNFFVEDHWHQLVPASWRPHLDALSLGDLGVILQTPHEPPSSNSGVWPLSLMAFLACAHSLRLPGQMAPRGSTVAAEATDTKHSSESSKPAQEELRWKRSGRCAEEAHITTALRESVKPKKMHEIVQLSALTNTVARATECDQIVDVGSGLGYLRCILASAYAIRCRDYPPPAPISFTSSSPSPAPSPSFYVHRLPQSNACV